MTHSGHKLWLHPLSTRQSKSCEFNTTTGRPQAGAAAIPIYNIAPHDGGWCWGKGPHQLYRRPHGAFHIHYSLAVLRGSGCAEGTLVREAMALAMSEGAGQKKNPRPRWIQTGASNQRGDRRVSITTKQVTQYCGSVGPE